MLASPYASRHHQIPMLDEYRRGLRYESDTPGDMVIDGRAHETRKYLPGGDDEK